MESSVDSVNSVEIEIRHSEPDDFQQIHAIFKQPKAHTGTLQLPYSSAEIWKNRLLLDPASGFSLVAVVDGKVVGNCGLVLNLNSPRRRHSALLGMAIHDDWHGKGIGKAMLLATLDQADNWLNLLRIELSVFLDNEVAIKLYQAHGFKIEGTLEKFAFQNGAYRDVYSMARLKPDSG